MTDEGAKAFAAAACLQAIKDYTQLCEYMARGKIIEADDRTLQPGPTFHREYNGKSYTGDKVPNYSFAQIEEFFHDYGELWAGMDPQIVLDYLLEKKRSAARRARMQT